MQTVLDSEGIKKLLPHRYPFLLVDRVIELTPREKIVGIKQVSINEPFFQGHFPGAPVMPGVLVIEALAQCGAILALREIEDRNAKLVLFTGIREARFRRPVVPGDTLILEVTAIRVGSRVQRMRGEAMNEKHGKRCGYRDEYHHQQSVVGAAALRDRRD